MFVPIARSSRVVVLVGALFVPSVLVAQNQVQNPNFDAGIATFWTATIDPCPGCSAALDNANGFPATPSAQLVSTTAAGTILLSDCTAYSAPGDLDLGAFERTNTATGGAVSQIGFFFWTNTTCDAGFAAGPALANLGSPAPGWIQVGAVGFTPPAANGFFTVSLQARVIGAPGTADFSYDHVYLGPPGTTPVELETFVVE